MLRLDAPRGGAGAACGSLHERMVDKRNACVAALSLALLACSEPATRPDPAPERPPPPPPPAPAPVQHEPACAAPELPVLAASFRQDVERVLDAYRQLGDSISRGLPPEPEQSDLAPARANDFGSAILEGLCLTRVRAAHYDRGQIVLAVTLTDGVGWSLDGRITARSRSDASLHLRIDELARRLVLHRRLRTLGGWLEDEHPRWFVSRAFERHLFSAAQLRDGSTLVRVALYDAATWRIAAPVRSVEAEVDDDEGVVVVTVHGEAGDAVFELYDDGDAIPRRATDAALTPQPHPASLDALSGLDVQRVGDGGHAVTVAELFSYCVSGGCTEPIEISRPDERRWTHVRDDAGLTWLELVEEATVGDVYTRRKLLLAMNVRGARPRIAGVLPLGGRVRAAVRFDRIAERTWEHAYELGAGCVVVEPARMQRSGARDPEEPHTERAPDAITVSDADVEPGSRDFSGAWVLDDGVARRAAACSR